MSDRLLLALLTGFYSDKVSPKHAHIEDGTNDFAPKKGLGARH